MKEEISRLREDLIQVHKVLLGETEVLKYMSCEQCQLKARAERLERAAGVLMSGCQLLERMLASR